MTKAAQAKSWTLHEWADGSHRSWPEPGGGAFSTTFASTENPISEGGIWLNGETDGGDWHDCRTTGGNCVGAADNFGSRYADDIACLKTAYREFSPAQWAQGTVYRADGYSGGGGSHEVELLLRWSISAGEARGYEASIGIRPGGTYAFIVRWNGDLGDYTTLWDPDGSIGSYVNEPTPLADGDVIRAEIDADGLITLYQNELVLGSVTNTTWTSGQPGVGFWPVDGATAANMGWSNFSAGDLEEPGPTHLAVDLFERSNGGLGADWTTTTGETAPQIISGEVHGPSVAVYGARYTALAAPNDGYAEIAVGSVVCTVSDEGVGPAYRIAAGAQTHYLVQTNTEETRLYRVVAGTYTQLGSDGAACETGDVLRLTCNGTSISVQRNGTTIIGPVTDAAIASGSAGLWCATSSSPGRIASFAFGEL